jgi:dTDP-4-dehydrorhamnose reductase
MHLGGPERLSRFEMGALMAAAAGAPPHLVEPGSQAEMASPEPRARDVSLDSSRYAAAFGEPPGRPLREALRELLSRPPD